MPGGNTAPTAHPASPGLCCFAAPQPFPMDLSKITGDYKKKLIREATVLQPVDENIFSSSGK